MLSRKEKKIIKAQKPWGIILFKRNIKTFSQLKKLTTDIRNCLIVRSYLKNFLEICMKKIKKMEN